MQKYKRPTKHKGLRSIPLRNPRKVDMFRFDPDTGKMKRLYQKPVDGPTEECFKPDNVWSRVEDNTLIIGNKHYLPKDKPKYIIVKTEKTYVERRMYIDAGKYWFEDRYTTTRVVFVSRVYSRQQAYLLSITEDIVWLSHFSF